MKVIYDRETDTLTVILSDSPVAESDEDKPGVILDYDGAGNLVSLEILDAARRVNIRARSNIKWRRLRNVQEKQYRGRCFFIIVPIGDSLTGPSPFAPTEEMQEERKKASELSFRLKFQHYSES